MPAHAPKFDQKDTSQKGLEKLIEDDLVDLKIKLSTEDFTKNAVQAYKKREKSKPRSLKRPATAKPQPERTQNMERKSSGVKIVQQRGIFDQESENLNKLNQEDDF